MDRPKLRPIDAFPVQVRGESMIALHDPQDLATGSICVSPAAFSIIRLFDGERDISDVRAEVVRATREIVPAEAIEKLVRQLDEHHYLESPAFEAYREGLAADFRASLLRPPAHAGGAYAAEPAALRAQIDGFFLAPGGPGEPARGDRAAGAGAEGSARGPADGPVRGLVAPHIDFHRGGPCYAWAYRRLARAPRPARFVVFGTSHGPMNRLFGLTRKRYATPFGESRADGGFVDALAARVGDRYFEDEFAHRGEHSVEFQVVFLQYLFGPDVAVVPILCGSFEWFLSKGRLPTETHEVQEFLGAVGELLADGTPTCLVAGADLSHVGPRFGDAKRCGKAFLDLVRRHDLEGLARAEAGDAAGFYKTIAEIGDRHRVCGLAPIFTVLSLLDDAKGRLLKYDQAVAPDGSQCVSFASLAYPG